MILTSATFTFSVCLLAAAHAGDTSSVSTTDTSRVQEPNKKDTTFVSTPVRERRASPRNATLVQDELTSAKHLAGTGAVFYGVGTAVEVVGAVMFLTDYLKWAQPAMSGGASTSATPPMRGLYVTLVGGVTAFGGSIACNMGGSKAQIAYETAYEESPRFIGWSLFFAAIGCSAGSTILTVAAVPVAPAILSLTGFILDLSSVIHSCNYTNRLYAKSIVLTGLTVLPIFDRQTAMPIGFKIAASY